MREKIRLVGCLPKRAVGCTILLKGHRGEAAVIRNAGTLDAWNLCRAMARHPEWRTDGSFLDLQKLIEGAMRHNMYSEFTNIKVDILIIFFIVRLVILIPRIT